MEQYKNKRQGMIEGYKVLLFAGLVLLFLFIVARAIVKNLLNKIEDEKRADQILIHEQEQHEQDHLISTGTGRNRSVSANQAV